MARLAQGRADMARVMAFRRAAFPRASGAEEDAQDALSAHVVMEGEGEIQAYFRVMLFGWGAGLAQGYAARFYDVGPLSGYARPIAEMGRFCVRSGGVHPDVLRLSWAAMTRIVDEGQAGLPPLLRTYLGMGGWVSDHAVVDRELDTLHVFTCVEVDRVPAARAASLRAVAG